MNLMSTKKLVVLVFTLLLGLSSPAQHGLEWAKRMGGYGNDRCGRIVLDTAGNVYTTGTIVDSADFGDGKFMKGYRRADVFVSKHDAAGNLAWARIYGGVNTAYGDEQGNHITIDKAGNLYITGSFDSTAYFNGSNANGQLSSMGGADIFILKLSSAGEFLWVKQFGSASLDQGWAIKYHAGSNYLYAAGIFNAAITFGNTTLNNITGSGADIYNLKLDTAGSVIWARQFDGSSGNACRDMGVDSAGNVYTTGYFQGLTDFDPDTTTQSLISLGGNDVFIVKLDPEGKLAWAKQFGGLGEQLGFGIAVDHKGNSAITGRLSRNGYFVPNTGDTLKSNGYDDAFLVKLDADGNYIWGQNFGATSYEDGTGVTIDAVGNIYFTGFFRGKVDFNPRNPGKDTITSFNMNGADIFIAKMDAAGNYNWAYGIGGRNGDVGGSIAVSSKGEVYAAGTFTYTVDFDPGPDSLMLSVPQPTSAVTPYTDVYVLKLVCKDSSTTYLAMEDCEEVIFNGIHHEANGEYRHQFLGQNGCDSSVYLQVTITEIERPDITVKDFTLGTSLSYTTYQWYKNDVLIPGATDSAYTVSENALYKVVVTNEKGCIDTSDAYSVTNVPGSNIAKTSAGDAITLYPNPVRNYLHVHSPNDLQLRLRTIEGRQLGQWQKTDVIDLSAFARGIYLVECRDKEGKLLKTGKVILQ